MKTEEKIENAAKAMNNNFPMVCVVRTRSGLPERSQMIFYWGDDVWGWVLYGVWIGHKWFVGFAVVDKPGGAK